MPATPAQVALVWLLDQKPWIAPIPGTTKLHRLEENLGGADVELTPGDLRELGDLLAKVRASSDWCAPMDVSFHIWLALTYDAQGKKAPARREIELARRLKPDRQFIQQTYDRIMTHD
jgi:hypothetical protein